MTYLHSSLFILHIIFGSTALILFWVPMYTKKGQLNHKKFGRYYRNVMYAVAGTGAVMAALVLAIPLTIKHEYADRENAAQIAESIRYFWSFLLYLALLSYTSTKHGDAVLRAKENRAKLRTFAYVAPIALLFACGPLFIGIGIVRSNVLHTVFGILGMLISTGMLRYIYRKSVGVRAYILEHVGSMIGSGIGAYTAFLAFGGRQFLDAAGGYQVIFWIAPGVIGSVLSFVLCKKYGKIFKVGDAKLSELPDAQAKFN